MVELRCRPTVAVLIAGVASALLYATVRSSAHLLVVDARAGDARVSSQAVEGAVYIVGTLLLFGVYAWLLECVRRTPLRGVSSALLALAFPLLFQLGLLFDSPTLSMDALTYTAYGYLVDVGGNPYTEPARRIFGTPFGQQLLDYGWGGAGPSPYGPLWNLLAGAIVSIAGSAVAAVIMTKAVVVIASLGCAGLIAWILGRSHPAGRQVGTLAYLWNPLVVVEFAGEGHNDSVMILAALTSLAATLRLRPTSATVIAAVGALAKYLPLLLLPAEIMFLWRAASGGRRHVLAGLAMGAVVGMALALVAYGPFWVGPATLQTLARAGEVAAPRPGSSIRTAVFVIVVAIVSWRVRDPRGLLTASAAIATLWVVFGSPSYWAWYVALPVALLSLVPTRLATWTMLAMSACAELQAPVAVVANSGLVSLSIIAWAPRAARLLPLVVCTAGALHSAWPDVERLLSPHRTETSLSDT